MTLDILVPTLGEDDQAATLVSWKKQIGEVVDLDDVIVEIETDKASIELPAPAKGVLSEQLFNKGDIVRVGDVIARMSGLPAEAPLNTPDNAAIPTDDINHVGANKLRSITIPKLPNDEKYAVLKWLKPVGAHISKGVMIFELKLEAGVQQFPAYFDSILTELRFKDGDLVAEGDLIAIYSAA